MLENRGGKDFKPEHSGDRKRQKTLGPGGQWIFQFLLCPWKTMRI